MRRRAPGHKVDTFPFLAVLLCAMGSLILMLLVLDRRAKYVALAKARAARTRVTEESEQMAAARRAEWERRQQALHAQLAQEQDQVEQQFQALRKQAATTATKLAAQQVNARALNDRIQTEAVRLRRGEDELATKQVELKQADQQSAAARVELTRLTTDLARLEQTLADLKALRQRQQQTYSVVPYQGKRGDNRRPLYVECAAKGLLFHPDRKSLQGLGVTAGDIRQEVEQRIGQQRSALPEAERETVPYLLMLVRPDGITTYYQTMAALAGIKLDFGYEFIDAHWVLDFPTADEASAAKPWMLASSSPAANPTSNLVSRPAQPQALRRYAGFNFGGASTDRGVGEPTAVPENRSAAAAIAAGSGTAVAHGDTPRGAASVGIGQPMPGVGSAVPGGSAAEQLGNPVGAPQTAFAPPTGFGRGGSSSGGPLPQPVPSPGGRGAPSNIGGSQPGSATGPLVAGTPLEVTAPPSTPVRDAQGNNGNGRNPDARGVPQRDAANPVAEGRAPGQPSGGAPSLLPPMLGQAQDARGKNEGGAGPEASAHARPGPSPQDATQAEEPPASGLPDPLARVLPTEPGKKPSRPAPLRGNPFLANRDWVIGIECQADAVVLLPTGTRFAAAALDATAADRSRLREALERLIGRRQASVREGEPPYRPQLRFLVRPDGLRTYYLAYPALESLHVPMTRENLEPAEDKKPKSPAHSFTATP